MLQIYDSRSCFTSSHTLSSTLVHTPYTHSQRWDKVSNVRNTYPENSVEDKDEIFDALNSPSDSHAAEIV